MPMGGCHGVTARMWKSGCRVPLRHAAPVITFRLLHMVTVNFVISTVRVYFTVTIGRTRRKCYVTLWVLFVFWSGSPPTLSSSFDIPCKRVSKRASLNLSPRLYKDIFEIPILGLITFYCTFVQGFPKGVSFLRRTHYAPQFSLHRFSLHRS